jgi:hypothetical protein
MAEKAAVTGNVGGKPLSHASQTKVQDALKTALHEELLTIHRPTHIEITHIDITIEKAA